MKSALRTLADIAFEVQRDWGLQTSIHAIPYLKAMQTLNTTTAENISTAMYGADTAKSVVLYFLSNARTWRGETARRVKAELNEWVA